MRVCAQLTSKPADAYPSHLEPPVPTTPEAALQRARINLFVETFTSKVASFIRGTIIAAKTQAEKEAKANATIAAIKNDIVPLLQNAAPFFGGSKEFTLAEVNTASFVLRIYTLGKEEYGFVPAWVLPELRKIEVWQKWVDAVLAKESVTGIYDEKANVQMWKEKAEKARAAEGKL
jgi:glutathione S-transferase